MAAVFLVAMAFHQSFFRQFINQNDHMARLHTEPSCRG
jgi:hypothetical protein